MRNLVAILAVTLFCAGSALAQAPSTTAPKPKPRAERFDCSQAKDPARCEERRAKAKEAYGKAQAACQGKEGTAHRDCMRMQMCSQAKDPAACEARAKEIAARREQARQACQGKQGDELRNCLHAQRAQGAGKK